MHTYNRTKLPGGFSPAVLLLLGAVLTIAIILGIKFLVVDESNISQPPSSGQADIFKGEESGVKDPNYNPAARSEITSGDSLDMFTKANEGYAADESSSTAVEEGANKTTAVTGKKQAPRELKKVQQGTAIPRLQGVKTFGTSAPAPKGGSGMPDMAEMMKQAQQKQGD
jgi:hypothetical protein